MQQPVTVIVDRDVCPGKKDLFEELLKGIINASSQFTGYIDTHVLKPATPECNRYKVLFRFDNEKSLEQWVNSDERLYWVEKIDKLIAKPTTLQVITGLETWFALPGKKTLTPPPRYKMAVVSWLAITPLLIVYNFILGPYLQPLPLIPRFIVSTPGIVLIMTYFWMPLMTKLFRNWLYPNNKD